MEKLSYSEAVCIDSSSWMTHPLLPMTSRSNDTSWGEYLLWALPMLNLSEGISASSPKRQTGKKKKKPGSFFSTPGIPTVFTGIPNPILLGYISKQSVSFYPLHWKLVQKLLILSSSGPLLNLPERCSCCCIIARCRGVPGRGFRRG